jgi:hypothetical protein
MGVLIHKYHTMSPEAQNFDNDNEKKNLKNKPDSKQEL